MQKCTNELCGRTDDDIGKCGNFLMCPKRAVPVAVTDVILHCPLCEVTRVVSAARIMHNVGVRDHTCLQGACQAVPVTPHSAPDRDLPEWTEEMFARAALYKDGRLVRPATGTLTQPAKERPARGKSKPEG